MVPIRHIEKAMCEDVSEPTRNCAMECSLYRIVRERSVGLEENFFSNRLVDNKKCVWPPGKA